MEYHSIVISMPFIKGHPQYNSGKTHFKKGERAKNWNGYRDGDKPPHTGKTKEDYPNLSRSGVKKGNVAWNKGKKLSSEHRLKAIKNLKHARGEDNNAWKGGVSTLNQRIRGTKSVKQWKKDVFYRDNFECQFCMKRGGTLNAHHIIRFADCIERRTDLNNGITLCEECHKSIKYKEGEWESLFNFILETQNYQVASHSD